MKDKQRSQDSNAQKINNTYNDRNNFDGGLWILVGKFGN